MEGEMVRQTELNQILLDAFNDFLSKASVESKKVVLDLLLQFITLEMQAAQRRQLLRERSQANQRNKSRN